MIHLGIGSVWPLQHMYGLFLPIILNYAQNMYLDFVPNAELYAYFCICTTSTIYKYLTCAQSGQFCSRNCLGESLGWSRSWSGWSTHLTHKYCLSVHPGTAEAAQGVSRPIWHLWKAPAAVAQQHSCAETGSSDNAFLTKQCLLLKQSCVLRVKCYPRY